LLITADKNLLFLLLFATNLSQPPKSSLSVQLSCDDGFIGLIAIAVQG